MNTPSQRFANARPGSNGTLRYDAIIIGAGQAGGPLAGALAKAGKRVALVEREHVGGTCVNVGCTPTKTMVASAAAADIARRGHQYGVNAGPVKVDLELVRARKRSIVEMFREGSRGSLERIESLDLIFGDARFDGPRKVAVVAAGDDLALEADIVVINVGTRPEVPPIRGIDVVDALDSTTVMELGDLPRRLLVLGGGYVGVEFAQMFRRFGSEVTLVQSGPQLLAREDQDIAETLAEILAEDGIEVLTNAQATAAARSAGGIELTVRLDGQERRVEGSHLLVAAGRRPNTDGLGLEAAGVETDARGYVVVDDQLRTSAEGVWALGDVNGGPAFTHISYDDYRIVRDRLLKGSERTVSQRQVPYTVYTDPQLGRVGLSEREARATGRRIAVAKMPAERAARALETGNARGVWKAVVDLDSEEILGAAILGHEGGEIMSVVQVAMMGGLSYKALRDAVFAHPTYAESLNNLFMTLGLD
jgi:pyruvate/2-oxoglutarate dehydrogenase complex dihydrolipoamide dehydrogenase (E3) component